MTDPLKDQMPLYFQSVENTPFAVHLRKIYNHLRQQLKL